MQGYKLYNVYDENDEIVFVGTRRNVCSFLGVALRTFDCALREGRDLKRNGHSYFTATRESMLDYEIHRRNPKGYKRDEV